MAGVALITFATGRYAVFWEGFLSGARRMLAFRHDLYCFTDQELPGEAEFIPCRHLGWPGATLRRPAFILEHAGAFEPYGMAFLLDVDFQFIRPIHLEDIAGRRVAVRHYAFEGRRGTFEERPESAACVPPDAETPYYMGGFWGGMEFMALAARIAAGIASDARRGITAVWHDESHLNRALWEEPPDKELPAGWIASLPAANEHTHIVDPLPGPEKGCYR